MSCGGHHFNLDGITYCIRFPPGTEPPISEGDLIVTDVRRWLESSPAGCDEPPVTQETIWVEGGFQPYTYADAPPLMLGLKPPSGRPAANETQVYRLPVCRDWAAPPGIKRDLDKIHKTAQDKLLQRRKEKQEQKEGATSDQDAEDEEDVATERDWRVCGKSSSTSGAVKERRRKITILPAGVKVDEQLADGLAATAINPQEQISSKNGVIEVKLDNSPFVIRNRFLFESLKDPLLKVHSPPNVDSAIEALEQGKPVLVDWEDPEDEIDFDEYSTVLDWIRIIPRVKPDDLIYYINDEGSLTSRAPDHLAAPAHEPKTIMRSAMLFEEQRKELREAVLGDGWPCQVVDGKIVIELFGQTIHLGQAQVKPKPVHPGVHARLKLRQLGKGDKDWLCQPMAATAEASWVINRYEVLFEYKRLTRRYEPFAVRVDADWRELFGPLAEALTQSVAKSKDARLFHSPKRGEGDKYELQREIFTRIYDGGARFPLTPVGDGFGEYPLPGGAAAYARRGVHKTRLGVVASSPEEHDHKEMIHGPALSSGMPHDWLMDGRESNECDPFDGLHFEVCPSGKPARTTMFMAPSMMGG